MLIIFFHGYGANGQDMQSMAQWFAQSLHQKHPVVHVACPNGIGSFAHGADSLQGHDGFQWFDLGDFSIPVIVDGLEQSFFPIDQCIHDLQRQYGVEDEQTALVGFSQGAMVALHYVLSVAPRKLGAVVAYSGIFFPTHHTKKTILPLGTGRMRDASCCTPLLLAHGDLDEVVPFFWLARSVETLKNDYGYRAKSVAYKGVGHFISQQGIDDGIRFIDTHVKG
jgi:phospholipase/carboxylesterase